MKVRFGLERDDEGWPPAASEGVWARPVKRDEYVLDNVPWFALGVAFGDRVRAVPNADGVLTVREKLEWSGRYTIRVIPSGDASSEEQIQDVIDAFSPLGAECEGGLPAFNIVALDIPPTAALARIKALLQQGEVEGRWGYEEGFVDDAWVAI